MSKNAQYTAYDNIYQDIKEKILLKKYKPNDRLPSVIELCNIYKTSDSTIRKSLDILKKNGLIYSKKRVGLFVSESNSKQYLLQFHEIDNLKNITDHYEILSIEILAYNYDEIDCIANKKILFIERMYYNDVMPILYRLDYIPFNANFNIEKSNARKWIDETGYVLDSYYLKKYISIKLENTRNDIKDKMIIPYHMGMFKIEKRYYTQTGTIAAYSKIYIACSDINLKMT